MSPTDHEHTFVWDGRELLRCARGANVLVIQDMLHPAADDARRLAGAYSGPFVVKNTGGRPIQLDGVELVGLQKGLTLRGAYVVAYPQHPSGPRPRSATIGIGSGYHRSREDRTLDGATVAPHTQVAIVLGVEAAKAGRFAWTAVDVTYHEGGHMYTLRSPVAARICVPKAPYVGENGRDCPPPNPLDH